MDGTKLPPYIMVKGKESGHVICELTLETMGYPQDQFYTIQDKAWIDTCTFNDWIDCAWAPFTRQQADCCSYLIIDGVSYSYEI